MLLVNQLGYAPASPKTLIVSGDDHWEGSKVNLVRVADNHVQARFTLPAPQTVSGWHQSSFYLVDFSEITTNGHYVFIMESGVRSPSFVIDQDVLTDTLPDILRYFDSQRCRGAIDDKDSQSTFFNHPELGCVNLSGGWFDASGDTSKYLSHLSYTNYMNPQQTPMLVWNFLIGAEHLGETQTAEHLRQEAFYGADFLQRMQHPSGYFYMTLFDRWSKDLQQREVCAYRTQQGIKSDDWQAGLRQGGGVTIAALAEASRNRNASQQKAKHWQAAAVAGYWHLKEHNIDYLDDGQENIIDHYCALLAAVALFRATGDSSFQQESDYWAAKLMSNTGNDRTFDFYWKVHADKERPYFHAAEAGLPTIALMYYLQYTRPFPEFESTVKQCLRKALTFELEITYETTNPFGLARQYVQGTHSSKRSAFFIPHDNESGYWWQGENARLASLAAMAFWGCRHFPELATSLRAYAQQQLNWIFGCNPFSACMLVGYGQNNPHYRDDYPSTRGGVCNGITSGYTDENDIALAPVPYCNQDDQNWRWGEQWLPHASWLQLAICLSTK